ncbi:hypothetical protein E5D57_006298 [Metarhizium anisopliae]|nr:hypothetical protein E5D57_006298 [Metarhizium anisopliae]
MRSVALLPKLPNIEPCALMMLDPASHYGNFATPKIRQVVTYHRVSESQHGDESCRRPFQIPLFQILAQHKMHDGEIYYITKGQFIGAGATSRVGKLSLSTVSIRNRHHIALAKRKDAARNT